MVREGALISGGCAIEWASAPSRTHFWPRTPRTLSDHPVHDGIRANQVDGSFDQTDSTTQGIIGLVVLTLRASEGLVRRMACAVEASPHTPDGES